MSAARRIGEQLAQEMRSQGWDVKRLAEMTGKGEEHVQAVLDGYPHSTQRPTQLDTVDDVAAALGLELALTRTSGSSTEPD